MSGYGSGWKPEGRACPPIPGHPAVKSQLPITAIRSAHLSQFKVASSARTAALIAAVP